MTLLAFYVLNLGQDFFYNTQKKYYSPMQE